MSNFLVAIAVLTSAWTVIFSSHSEYSPCANVPKPSPPCEVCNKCVNSTWECERISCLDAQCADGYTEHGKCCLTCPTGQNCKIYGDIVPKDKTKAIDKMICTCSEGADGLLGAVCIPIGST